MVIDFRCTQEGRGSRRYVVRVTGRKKGRTKNTLDRAETTRRGHNPLTTKSGRVSAGHTSGRGPTRTLSTVSEVSSEKGSDRNHQTLPTKGTDIFEDLLDHPGSSDYPEPYGAYIRD